MVLVFLEIQCNDIVLYSKELQTLGCLCGYAPLVFALRMTKVAKEVSYVLALMIMHRGRKNAIDENKNSL